MHRQLDTQQMHLDRQLTHSSSVSRVYCLYCTMGNGRERLKGACAGESKGSEELADVGSMLATWDHDDVRVWAAAKYVRAQGPEEAVVVCVDVCGSCYHRGPCGCPEAGPPPQGLRLANRPVFPHQICGDVQSWTAA